MDVKLRLEEISGEAYLVQRYSHVIRQRLSELGIKALIISGNVTDWEEYNEAALAEMCHIIQAAELPILGICCPSVA
jgi:GMP synthase-like glutamine amidotransferase